MDFSALWTITHLTLAEARRRRIVTAAALCGAAFLAVFASGVFFAFNQLEREQTDTFIQRQATVTLLNMAGLYAANFLAVLFAVLLPVDTLSGEVESGIMQTVASKPIRRSEILLGKWLAHGAIVIGYLLVLSGGVVFVIRVAGGFVPLDLERGLPLMMLEVLLLMTVAVAGGTRFSTVTNGITALGFYGIAFVGGWMEQVSVILQISSLRTVGIIASLISPPDALWRMAAYYFQPAIVRDLAPAVFTTASLPSPLMVWWAVGFMLLTLAWAIRSFNRRAL
jgi:ABC-type transport system involved in multi-copper enzyme maturation permease subunit